VVSFTSCGLRPVPGRAWLRCRRSGADIDF